MDVTTKARVQALLAAGGQKSDPLDTLLPTLISDVSARFEQYLDRALEATSRTIYVDAKHDLEVVFLEGYPVASVTSVEYDPDRAFGGAGEVYVEDDDFVVDEPRGLLVFEGVVFGNYRQAVEIVYTGGLGANQAALEAAFPALVHAADLQVAYLARRRSSLGGTATAAGSGSKSYVGAYDLLPEVKNVLDGLRRRGF